MAISFKIPEEHYIIFKTFINLSSSIKEDIYKSLGDANFSGKPKDLVDKISCDLDGRLEKNEIWDVVRVYLNLVNLKNTIESDSENDQSFEAILKTALSQTNQEDLNPSEKVIKDFMELILSSESISLETKLWDLQGENQRILFDAEFFQDIRPSFDLNGKIEGCVVINNLKITYRENNLVKHFFVALDNDDLNKISKSLKVAQENAKNIQKAFPDILFIEKEDI